MCIVCCRLKFIWSDILEVGQVIFWDMLCGFVEYFGYRKGVYEVLVEVVVLEIYMRECQYKRIVIVEVR